jgi:cellulose synthase/poly-beta-1,6-N-acetylglucosamine synthase-like glycosyltransferase
MKLSVLVTTYGRRPYVERCVASLLAQERLPDEVVLVTRLGDTDTEAYVEQMLNTYSGPVRFRHGRVEEPGVLAANRVGFELLSGDIVCFIDDDAAAKPDWLRRIERWFAADPKLGAVGGRDIIHTQDGIVEVPAKTVGRIRWYGKIVGNHEKVFKGAAYADHLKGVNMSYRRELLPGFDERILGNAHHYETDLCLAVKNQGFRVLFDGELVVDHYQDAPRHLAGARPGADAEKAFFIQHNRVYVMLKNLKPARRTAFLVYTFLIDGVSILGRAAMREPGVNPRSIAAMYRGKVAGLRDYLSASAND